MMTSRVQPQGICYLMGFDMKAPQQLPFTLVNQQIALLQQHVLFSRKDNGLDINCVIKSSKINPSVQWVRSVSQNFHIIQLSPLFFCHLPLAIVQKVKHKLPHFKNAYYFFTLHTKVIQHLRPRSPFLSLSYTVCLLNAIPIIPLNS